MMIEKNENLEDRFTVAILIASDRAAGGIRPDSTGPALKKCLEEAGFYVQFYSVVADDEGAISAAIRNWAYEDGVNVILTSGGTGLGPRDVTPEATLKVIGRRVPGLEEAMRHASVKITPNAMLSRAVAGTAANSLIINLPGSSKGAVENFKVVEPALRHAIELIIGRKPDP